MSRLFLPNYDDLATFGRDRGTGTALPSTDLRRGDVYQHTALGLHVYTGTAWRQDAPHPLSTTQRTAIATNVLYDGYEVYDTTLAATYRWWAASAAWISDTAPPRARLIPGTDGTGGNSGGGGGDGNIFTRVTFQAVRWGAAPILDGMTWAAAQATRLVCTIPGEYLATGSAAFAMTAATPLGGRLALLRKNGVDVVGSAATMTPYSGYHAIVPIPPTLVRLAKDDYIELVGYHDCGAGAAPLSAPPVNSGGQQASFQAVWTAP